MKITTKLEIVDDLYTRAKAIYINGKKTKFFLVSGGLYLKQNPTVLPHCIIRENNNSLALQVFKKAMGIKT